MQAAESSLGFAATLFSPIKFDNVQFAPSACFANIEDEDSTYNEVYCINNTIILAMGIANIIVVSYVTYLHFKVSLHSHPLKEILLKVKTTILLLVLLFELLVVIRYSLDFENRKLYMVILTFHQFLSSIIFY